MKNSLKEKMHRAERTLGTFLSIASPSVVECLAFSGLDYVIIDCEHASNGPKEVLECSRAARLYGITPLVRVQDISRASILKPLDAGAMGLIIPNVNCVEEAKEIVRHGKYAPIGSRGIAPSAGTDYWMSDFAQFGIDGYLEMSNREVMLLPQCETLGALNDLEKIVALDGVDGIFVGPFDLSSAMGIPGQFQLPEFKEALRHIQAVCTKAGKQAIIYAGAEDAVREGFDMGYNSVSYSIDALILTAAYKDAVNSLK